MLGLGVALLVAGSAACDDSADAQEAARVAGGTPAPDGTRGYCCPARIGGCALTGGYRESGECPKDFDICDNMCEQRIVKDEHGCDVLTYKTPPRTTTFAGPQSCDDPRFNGQDRPPSDPDASTPDASTPDASTTDTGVASASE